MRECEYERYKMTAPRKADMVLRHVILPLVVRMGIFHLWTSVSTIGLDRALQTGTARLLQQSLRHNNTCLPALYLLEPSLDIITPLVSHGSLQSPPRQSWRRTPMHSSHPISWPVHHKAVSCPHTLHLKAVILSHRAAQLPDLAEALFRYLFDIVSGQYPPAWLLDAKSLGAS